MATTYPKTIDYAGRQVDIELLQSVAEPTELIRVYLSLSGDTPKLATGIQKLVHRYAMLLLTTVTEVKFDQTQGTRLLRSVVAGTIQNRGQLQNTFADANSAVLAQMRADDADTDKYGTIPDDEAIVSTRLLDYDIDVQASSIFLRVRLTSRAGSGLTFIVPVTAPRT
jgi:hypothetical protein